MRMRKIMMGLALLATISAGAQELTSGIDRNNMNLKVKPGNDFYEYAAGGWMKSHPLDAEHADNGAFTDLFELSQEQVRGLILGYADGKQPQGSLGQKIGSLYRLAMDSVRRNREGAKPIQPVLQRVAAVKNVAEYQRLAAELDRRGQASMLFGIGVGADLRDAKNNIVSIGQGGMGLGTRDYYLNDDAQTKRVREAYRAYIVEVLASAGYDEATAQKKMEATMAIETRLARVAYDQVKLRDISANYHKMTYAQFCDEFPGIDWGNTFLLGGFPHFEYIDVSQPEPIHEVEKILADTPLDDLKSYMEVRVVTSASGLLSDDFRAAQFRLSSTMTGLQQDKPRWKRAVSLVNGCMGMALGKMYVEKYFPESSKERMVDLVHRLQDALAQRIDESTWMSQETKEKAKDKLRSFIIKIGYPDKWKNYDGMKVDESLSLYDNVAAISDWETCDVLSEKVGKPVDKMEWQMTPQTINAYYNPTTNEICFPAAILQPPFFDPKADDAANLGAIGGVIGHEMSHGFDDQGAQFDKDGNRERLVDGRGQGQLQRPHQGACRLLLDRRGRAGPQDQRPADARREHRRQRRSQHCLPCPAEHAQGAGPRREGRFHAGAALLPLLGPRMGFQHASGVYRDDHHHRSSLPEQRASTQPCPTSTLGTRPSTSRRAEALHPGKQACTHR